MLGQTDRTIKTDFKNIFSHTLVIIHLTEKRHKPGPLQDTSTILHIASKSKKLNIPENMEYSRKNTETASSMCKWTTTRRHIFSPPATTSGHHKYNT